MERKMNRNEIDRYASIHAAILADMAEIMAEVENMPEPESADYGDMAQLGRLMELVRELGVAAGIREDM